MRRSCTLAPAVAIALCAGLAHSATVVDAEDEFLDTPASGMMMSAGLSSLVTVDVSNITVDDSQGFSAAVFEVSWDPILTTVVGIGWDLDIMTTDAGRLSDLQIAFTIVDEFGDVVDGVVAQPSDVTFPADQAPFNETSADDGFALRSMAPPVIDLQALGLDFSTADRVIVELYTDFPGEPITLAQGSEVYIEVIPAPAGVMALGVAGLFASRRRR